MQRTIRRALTCTCMAAIAALLTACSSGFESFYQPDPNFNRAKVESPQQGEPRLMTHSSDISADAKQMEENGYVLIGSTSFNGPAVDPRQAQSFGKTLGAAVVLVKSQYTNTVSGSLVLPQYNSGQTVTSYTSGSATAYGTGGSAYGTYNGTTTTYVPGTTTYNAVPYNVQRFDYVATYWAKQRTDAYVFGAYFENLPPELRSSLGQNQGVVIAVVVRGTPAFNANILEGDAVLAMNGVPVADVPSFLQSISANAGRKVSIEVVRNGQRRTIDVQLNRGI